MAVTLIFVATCLAAIAFMLRFLVAICGPTGKPARVGYAVQIRPGCDEGEGGGGKHTDERIPQAPPVQVPIEGKVPDYADIPAWQHRPVSGASVGGNASLPR